MQALSERPESPGGGDRRWRRRRRGGLRLARRGVAALLLEAEDELALAASGTNSGILHTGFDSQPGELETRLILRSTELRDGPRRARRPGAALRGSARPRGRGRGRNGRLDRRHAEANGVPATLAGTGRSKSRGGGHRPGRLHRALADAAAGGGAEIRTGARVEAIERARRASAETAGGSAACRVAVNCAGLYADEVARLAGDESFEIYPRKGEFFVFEPPTGEPLDRNPLPCPPSGPRGCSSSRRSTARSSPGPTAHDQEDKADWSVRRGAGRSDAEGRATLPAAGGRRAGGQLRRPSPRRSRRQLPDRPSTRARADQRRGDPLDRALGVTGHRRARRRAGRRAGSRAGSGARAAPGRRRPVRAVVARAARREASA